MAAGSPHPAFEQWVQRRTEVCPKDKSEGGMRGNDALGRNGHDQQDDRNARMRRPRQSGREHNIDQRVGRNRTEQHPQTRHVLIRRDHQQQVLQRN